MKGIRIVGLAFLGFLAMAGCSAKRPPKASVPTSASPGVAALPVPEERAEPATEAPAPPSEAALSYDRVVVPPLQPAEPVKPETGDEGSLAKTPVAAKPSPAKRPTASPSTRVPEAETAAEPDPAKGTDLRAPSLKPMLSDGERRQLEGQINAHLERARRNFTLIREARLGPNERSVLEEARSFAARADQLRQSDPAVASSLAERAAILTQELLRKQ